MIKKVSAQLASDLARSEKTPVRESDPWVRRSRISVVPPLPGPLVDRLDSLAVLNMAYPDLEGTCKRIVKEDSRLSDEMDRMHVVQKLFTTIGFNHDVRLSLFRGITTVKRLLDKEVRNMQLIRQECMVEGPQ